VARSDGSPAKCVDCNAAYMAYSARCVRCPTCAEVVRKARKHPYDKCACGNRKRQDSDLCRSCNNAKSRADGGKFASGRTRYDFCGCGRRMRKGATRCIMCKRDEFHDEIARDLCECGKDKILTAPYCASCTVARAINRVNQAKAVQPKTTVYHVRRKPAPAKIDWQHCRCGSEHLVKPGHGCSVCWAIEFDLPEPTCETHLILDRFGRKA
jgi:hypothetical protein